ncbi:MAG: radical SAM protein [Promethearchaeota archaeon]
MKRLMDGTKLLWHMDRVKEHYDEGKRISPLLINIGATKKCNANCIYCYGVFQGKDQKSTIDREPLLHLFYSAPKLGVKAIEIIGDGEPTLNPHIYDAMDIGKKEGLDMAFSTNGILLDTDEKRENVLRNCSWMRFNLSAGTREGYKKIHRVDKFEKVVENIKRMVELKKYPYGYPCDVGLQAVYVPGLMDQDIIDESILARDLGVDYLLIKQCSLPEKGVVADISFDVNDYDKPEIKSILKRCESLSNDKTDIVVKWEFMQIGKRRPYDHCVDAPLIFQVSGNGKCYPCGYLFGNEEYEYGDLNTQSLQGILESEKYWGIIDKMKKFDVHNDCEGCCRHDKINEFLSEYLDKPNGVNFI